MKLLYSARSTFDSTYIEGNKKWDDYIQWSGLYQLIELVSLDGILNELLVHPDYDNADDWHFIDVEDQYQTVLFTTQEYVLKRMKTAERFNLLAAVINPAIDCAGIQVNSYEFGGYELLDKEFGNSALTNCGGFAETFTTADINDKGLIDDFAKAYDIQKRLLANNPGEHHADTNVIAIWRHTSIGR